MLCNVRAVQEVSCAACYSTTQTNQATAANSLEAQAHAELSLFMREPILPMNHEDGSFTNPLDWWRVNATRFPMVAKLVMQLLAIPATSALQKGSFLLLG
jgi:hypothetical protein